jgi:nucleotide-binding universal stress UspA family protein
MMLDTIRDTGPVVVGVDDSDSARDAARWAADLAADWGAPLWLSHIVDRPGTLSAYPLPGWLRELGTSAERARPGQTVTDVRYGSPGDQLLAQSHEARLLVLGSYGDAGWSGMLVGSNALRLVGACTCPLIVVRGSGPGIAPPRSGPVVVGVDGTAAGAEALRFAATVASRSQHRRLVAVHTWSDVVSDSGTPRRLDEDASTLVARGAALLDQYLEPVLSEHPTLTVERHVRADTPLRALLDHARDAWLVVVGQRRDRPAAGMLVGSTSRGLIEFALCPVAVVPPPTRP